MRQSAIQLRTARTVHIVRLAMLLALVWGLHVLGTTKTPHSNSSPAFDLATIQDTLPNAVEVRARPGAAQLWEVIDREGLPIAFSATTSPTADHVVGYAGPNDVLLILDDQQRITHAQLLASSDTDGHVNRVRESPNFWQQFVGWRSGQPAPRQLDGVSGATLTSLAIAEAISVRLSGERISLRFPEQVTLTEVQALLPEAAALRDDPQHTGMFQVLDSAGLVIGSIMRTGQLVDDIVGYQGPTELLMSVDPHHTVQKIRVRHSFDNEPYVRYTRQESSFWAKFTGRSLSELSRLDLDAEEIEGVSGATMTSMAVADTVRQAAQRQLELETIDNEARDSKPTATAGRWNWSLGEICTAAIAFLVVPWSLSRWRGDRRLRLMWQVLCLLAIVVVSGNLVSMALFAGWTRTGLLFRLAPGLTVLVVIALASPALLGRNVYCDHICPHGTAQQWIARVRGRVRLGRTSRASFARSTRRGMQRRGMHWALHASAVAIIALAMLWAVLQGSGKVPWLELSWLEPFDTYAWRIGLSVSAAIWVASLLLAVREPMGYCRLACPTGKVLEYVRLKRASWRVVASDMLLGLLTAVVWTAILL